MQCLVRDKRSVWFAAARNKYTFKKEICLFLIGGSDHVTGARNRRSPSLFKTAGLNLFLLFSFFLYFLFFFFTLFEVSSLIRFFFFHCSLLSFLYFRFTHFFFFSILFLYVSFFSCQFIFFIRGHVFLPLLNFFFHWIIIFFFFV